MPDDILKLALQVHGELLKLVGPATPTTIRASSVRFSANPALFGICLMAAFSFLAFGVPFAFQGRHDYDSVAPLLGFVQVLGGAGVGAAFYALLTASDYIKNSTFDPKYNSIYIIRFVLGIMSGLILTYGLKQFVGNGTGAGGFDLTKISDSALALVGGFAADVVARALIRVSDTLNTLFVGSDKVKTSAAKQKIEAESDKKTIQFSADTAQKLLAALADRKDKEVAVRKVIDELLKPK